MGEEQNVNLGRWDSVFARRMMRRGPVEVHRMLNDNSPLFSAIVRFKWDMQPDVRMARELNRILNSIKQIEPDKYEEYEQQILGAVKSGVHGCENVYEKYVKLINNPEIGKNYDDFVFELIDNSPKTRSAFWKLAERDDELTRFNLDFRMDYMYKDSKKLDILLLKLVFFMAFWRCNSELIFRCIRIYLRLQNDEARLCVAKVLWPDAPRLVNWYQCQYDAQFELYDNARKCYQSTIDDTRCCYDESKEYIEKKHDDIKRYKELIQTGQLAPFKKK